MPEIAYIKVDSQEGHNSIISSGLNIGDRIITGGLQEVIPGVPVKVVNQLSNETHENFFHKVMRKLKRIIKGIINGR